MSTSVPENYYQHDETSLKQILIFLYRGKWFFTGFLSIVAIITYFYLNTISPSYESYVTYRVPDDLTVSKINQSKFQGAKIIPSSDKVIKANEIFDMFNHKVFSTSFRERVFRKYNYLEIINSKGTNELNIVYSFLDKVRQDKMLSNNDSSYIFMRGTNPIILTNFLNDLIFEANITTLDDLKQIEYNQINKKISSLTREVKREEKILEDKRLTKINEFNKELLTARLAKIDDIDLDKLAVVYNNNDLSKVRPNMPTVYPLWYFYGEEFIEKELEQLKDGENLNNDLLIDLNASIELLKSYEPILDDDLNAVDISWSLVPTATIGPKKRLTMIITLTISFFFSIFFWYVIELFRSPKR